MKYAIEFLKQKGLDESLVCILTEFIKYQSRRRREDLLKEAPEIDARLKEIAARMNAERDEAKELLKIYNRWRRGEEIDQPDVTDIGKAIDKLTL